MGSNMDFNSNTASYPPPYPPQTCQIPQSPLPQQAPKRSLYFLPYGCFCGCSGCLIPFLLLFFIGLFCGSAFEEKVTRQTLSGPDGIFQTETCDKVAVIRIDETIMSDTGFIRDQIDDVEADETVKAIVLRMDTPGGTVSASDFYYNQLTKIRKETGIPIVVSMGGVCASGGYYISMAVGNQNEDVIFAEPTSWTGSIGVIISNYDLSGLAERVGVKEDSIRSHELKGMGSLGRSLTEKERSILQNLVNDAFGRFKEVVYTGRKKFNENHESLEKYATGEVFSTSMALEAGLIDKEGYLDDAICRAMELADLDSDTTQVYSYQRTSSLADLMTSANAKIQETPVDVLKKFASPRACYLWSVGE